MKFKFNRQDGMKDCGVCCLHNIIRYYNGYINFEKLRKITNTSKEGTSVLNLVYAANKVGLEANAYNCKYNLLDKQTFPFIAHIKVNNIYSHFIIIYKIEKDVIYIFDPIRGYLKYEKNLFLKEWTNVIIMFNKTDKLIKEKSDISFFKIPLLNNRTLLLLIILLSFFVSLLTLYNSINIGYILNGNIKKIHLYIFLFLIVILSNYIKNEYIFKFNYKFDKILFNNIYKHILHLPMSYHHSRPAGDTASKIYDLYSIKEFINEFLVISLFEFLLVIIILFYFFLKNVQLFFLVIFYSLVFFTIYSLFRTKINVLLQKLQESHAEVNSEMIESLIGIDSIKNLGLEKVFCNKHYKKYDEYLDNELKLNKIINVYSFIKELLKLTCLILSILILYISNNSGFIPQIYIIFLQLFSSYDKITGIDNLILKAKTSFRRIEDIFSIEEEKKTKTLSFKENIKFKHFSYNINELNIINDFNLEINKNDFILITGKSGVGKSTLFKSLTKQIHSNPNIYLDNKKLSNYSISYLRNKICYVSQNEYIFTDSIKNNILMDKKISKKEFNKILKICMVDKILKKRNININYLLEENGHNLSGGERQKILLARTLVKNSDFIILDETMNEIDVDSEREILKKINTEYNKTLILISHRLDNKDLFNKCIYIN